MNLKEKYCPKCATDKPISNFGKHKARKDGLTDYCKKCCAEKSKKYRENNPEKAAQFVKEAYEKNGDKYALTRKAYREKNRDYLNAWHRDYKKQNKGLVNSINARRRAAKLKATPVWANKFIIDEIYELAQLRTEMLNVQFHVDHIVPLINPMVCGLHVEHNLQIITEHENLIKHNSFEEAA